MYVLPGQRSCRWQAAPTPDRPAPTISTSTCSGMAPPGFDAVVSLHFERYLLPVDNVNRVSTTSTRCILTAMTAVRAAMPTSRGRRTSRPSGDDRQHAILATAEQLLAERDFADISIDDLARGAGISRPTFYFYFPSKNAVLLTLLDRVIEEAEG